MFFNQNLSSQVSWQQSDLTHQYQVAPGDTKWCYSSFKSLSELETWLDTLIQTGGHSTLVSMKQINQIEDGLATAMALPTVYGYSETVDLFIQCALDLGLLCVNNLQSRYYVKGVQAVDQAAALELIHRLAHIGNQREFLERRRLRQRDINERYHDYCHYVDALFARNDRLVVLRLDLAYAKEIGTILPLEDALSDLDRFFDRMRSHPLFHGKVGFIVKTEYGLDKGIHFHLILFFNGSQRNGSSHCHLAQQIGEYWVQDIVLHQGLYWNCNAQASDFVRLDRLGIGLIHWNEIQTRKNLCDYVLAYVCKHEQGLRCHYLPKARLIRRGHYPAPNLSGVGRPRKMISN